MAGELEWDDVSALSPHWRPRPGESAVEPVPGRLALRPEGLVFRAPGVEELVPADTILDAGPLAPGSELAPGRPAGAWMPKLLRRMRCPGFVVSTADGPWVFDGPHGNRRAEEVRRRFASGAEPGEAVPSPPGEAG